MCTKACSISDTPLRLFPTLFQRGDEVSPRSAQIMRRSCKSITKGRQITVSDAISIRSNTDRGSNTSPDIVSARAIQPAKHSGRSQYGCSVYELMDVTT